jgi:hypothetical protein
MRRVLASFAAKGSPVEIHGADYRVLCPSHDDSTPSLTISSGEKGVLVCCHVCGDQEKVFNEAVRYTGLTKSDFFWHRKGAAVSSPPVTLDALATAKKLPIVALTTVGVTECSKGLRIPYMSEKGAEVAVRLRHGLRGSESSWARMNTDRTRVSVYGAWKLPLFRQTKTLFIVEGESDCWTGWHYGYPVVGIPGKGAAKRAIQNTPNLLEGIEEVFVIEEPDDYEAGVFQRLVREGLTDLKYRGKFYVMRLAVKDLSEAHMQYGQEGFKMEMNRAYAESKDLGDWGAPAAVPAEAFRVANWVTRTEKAVFGVMDVHESVKKDGLSRGDVRAALLALEGAGWIRQMPPERKKGRPSIKYRRNPKVNGKAA